jgi:hypothetical protein
MLITSTATGASTKELMARLGHASADAALHHHSTVDRDQAIAQALSRLVSPKEDPEKKPDVV